jgi:hypothetical protein
MASHGHCSHTHQGTKATRPDGSATRNPSRPSSGRAHLPTIHRCLLEGTHRCLPTTTICDLPLHLPIKYSEPGALAA